jgi:protease-4
MSAVREGIVRGITQAFVFAIALAMVIVFAGVVVFAVFAGIGAGMAASTRGPGLEPDYVYVSGKRDSRNKLLVLRVEGPILGSPPRDRATQFLLGGFTYGYQVQRLLEQASDKGEIKGVLLHLQTPGGTIFGSRAIHDGVASYRQKTKKPVVAFVEGLSASGGVMAMAGASKIFADHGSLTGSIGVLGPQWLYYNKPVAIDGGLLGTGIVTTGGIEQTIITAGRGKDLGNPFRRPTDEEIASLTRMIETEYEAFVRHVAEQRHLDPQVIRERMGAMIFDNEAAAELGLIDGTRSQNEAVAELARMAGVAEDYQVVRPGDEDGTLVRRLLSALLDPGAAPPRMPVDRFVREELCGAATRYPLAYYGDPAALCR